MLALLIAATLGGGCGVSTGYGYTPSYGYARQTYVTYGATAPTYSYQAPAQYQAPYVAPKVDYQAVVGEYLREEYRAKKEEEQAARLARIEALLQKPAPAPVQQYQAPPPVPYQPVQVPSKASPQSPQFSSPQYPPAGQYPPPVPEKNQPSSFGGVGPPPLTGTPGGGSDAAVTQIVRNRCSVCHAAPAAKGAGVVLLDPTGNLAPMSPALMLMVQEDVKTGKMPKGGPELPDNELAIVSGWVGDHAPEIAAFLAQGINR